MTFGAIREILLLPVACDLRSLAFIPTPRYSLRHIHQHGTYSRPRAFQATRWFKNRFFSIRLASLNLLFLIIEKHNSLQIALMPRLCCHFQLKTIPADTYTDWRLTKTYMAWLFIPQARCFPYKGPGNSPDKCSTMGSRSLGVWAGYLSVLYAFMLPLRK